MTNQKFSTAESLAPARPRTPRNRLFRVGRSHRQVLVRKSLSGGPGGPDQPHPGGFRQRQDRQE